MRAAAMPIRLPDRAARAERGSPSSRISGVGIAAGGSRRASSTPTSRPNAAAPASACRSPRTSSKGWAARLPSSSAPGRRHRDSDRAAAARSREPSTAALAVRPATMSTRLDSARRRRRENPEGARPRAARRRARGRRRPRARARRSGCSRERTFDVLIVDNVMPELTGLDLIREFVASTPKAERPQILMMTAHATVESAHRGDEARRARLPAEAVRDRRAAGRRPRARSTTSACAPSTAI